MRSSWSVVDFVIVWLGGVLGATLFLGLGEVAGNTSWLLLVGHAGQYVGYTATILLLARRKKDPELGLSVEPSDVKYLALGLFLQLAMALAVAPLAELLMPEGHQPQRILEQLLTADTTTAFKVVFFGAAVVLTPLFEELVFRGVLLQAIVHRGRTFTIILTSIVFAAVHIPELNPDRLVASIALVIPPILLLAALLAWVTLRKGRLGPAIFIHSGWNLLAAIVILVPTELLESVG